MAALDALEFMVPFRASSSRPFLRRWLQVVLLLLLVLPSWGKKKEKELLAAYPILFKFFLFWWCAVVLAIMGAFIIDSMCWRYLGCAPVKWKTEFTFDGRASREAYWKQFVDPSSWSRTHPILQSADVRMVRVISPEDAPAEQKKEAPADAKNEKEYSLADPPSPAVVAQEKLCQDEIQAANGIRSEPSTRMQTIDFTPLKAGLGLVLHHKASTEQRSGLFYCSRECTLLETPEDGPWVFMMRTVEVGVGHVFLPGSEEVKVKLWPHDENGTLVCDMEGTGAVQSRIFRWWYNLSSSSVESAKAMMELFNEQLGHAKKAE